MHLRSLPCQSARGETRTPAHFAHPRECVKAGLRQDVFPVPEGEISIQWPVSLSPESFEDVGDWLDVLKRKIRRSVKTESGE